MIFMSIKQHYDEDSLSTSGESITFCDDDTIVHIKGTGIDWQIPLKQISVLITEIREV